MVTTWTDVRRANIQINKDKSLKRAERRMTLTVILLSLSDVRLVKQGEHRSRRLRCCIAESLLIWFPYDYLAQTHVHSARA
jgi:hypothetical protein